MALTVEEGEMFAQHSPSRSMGLHTAGGAASNFPEPNRKRSYK